MPLCALTQGPVASVGSTGVLEVGEQSVVLDVDAPLAPTSMVDGHPRWNRAVGDLPQHQMAEGDDVLAVLIPTDLRITVTAD
jgi:hypothetical protein